MTNAKGIEEGTTIVTRASNGLVLVCFALLVLTFSVAAMQASQSDGIDAELGAGIVGTWVSEPALGQLGVTQTSISFLEGGVYSHKVDFISFCDGRDR